jgi:hypothetical protein
LVTGHILLFLILGAEEGCMYHLILTVKDEPPHQAFQTMVTTITHGFMLFIHRNRTLSRNDLALFNPLNLASSALSLSLSSSVRIAPWHSFLTVYDGYEIGYTTGYYVHTHNFPL